MPYQLAVLDFDGVILNSEPYHFYIRESLLAEYCAGAQYDPVDCVGKSVPEFYAEMLRRSGADSDITERAKLLAEMHFERVFESIRDNHVAANPGVADFLRPSEGGGTQNCSRLFVQRGIRRQVLGLPRPLHGFRLGVLRRKRQKSKTGSRRL